METKTSRVRSDANIRLFSEYKIKLIISVIASDGPFPSDITPFCESIASGTYMYLLLSNDSNPLRQSRTYIYHMHAVQVRRIHGSTILQCNALLVCRHGLSAINSAR